jgi:hypothetical protein
VSSDGAVKQRAAVTEIGNNEAVAVTEVGSNEAVAYVSSDFCKQRFL